jgi:shikimate kinase
MRESRDYRNIALVGFMGTGKSTVGQLVAGMLHFRFLDTDEMIEDLTQRRAFVAPHPLGNGKLSPRVK